MKKRIKKKLTSKKARKISLLASSICIILLAILCFTSWPSDLEATEILVLVLCCTILPILTYLICYIVILKGDEIEIEEGNIELKKSVKEVLCKEKFIELYFIPRNNSGSEYKMLLAIIEKMDCRFFAKLKENDEIILIVKDKEDNEIYRCEISNYSYFNARFKSKSN